MKIKVIYYAIIASLIFASCNSSEGKEYDTRAVESLDKLTETIGELSSLSYTVESFVSDEKGDEKAKISDVYLKGPSKMYIKSKSSRGNKNFWYNGKKFAYFLFDKNEYDILNAPDNFLKLIDKINSKYGIYFPAADFLYPTLTDDLIENYNQILFFGNEKVDNVDCISIEASNEENLVQIWIDKETYLPNKMVITSKTNKNKYYEAVYTNWRINPKLPDVMFEFQPPNGSKQVKFQPKH